MAEDVETDQIDGAERCRFGPSESGAGERVHVFDGEIHLLHQAHDVEDGECADAIGDEVGRVFGVDDAFAQLDVGEMGDGFEQHAIGIGRGNEFEQPHVTRGIEEVRAKPAAAEVVGKAFGDFGHG